MITRKTSLVVILCLASFIAPGAGEDIPTLQPRENPVIAVRVPHPDVVARVESTRQGRALGLRAHDYSGRLPGFDARLASLREFLAALSQKNASNFWYSVSGTALSRPVGAMGGEWPEAENADAVSAWLEEHFPDAAFAVDMGRDARGRSVWAAANDAQTLRQITGGGSSRLDGHWRRDLRDFMTGDSQALGVWLNPRPIFGVASMWSGIDFRGQAMRVGMNLPEALVLEITPGDDLGATLLLTHVLNEPMQIADDASLRLDHKNPSLLRLHVPAPILLAERFGLDTHLFQAANLDIRSLSPRIATVDVWSVFEGETEWTLTCRMRDKPRFDKQWNRVLSWLGILAAYPLSGLSLEREKIGDDTTIYHIEKDDFACVAKVADAGNGEAYLFVASAVQLLPDAADITLSEDAPPCLAAWEFHADAPSRAVLAGSLEKLLVDMGRDGIDATVLDALMGHGDTGTLEIRGDSLLLTSARGTTPVLAAALAAYFEEHKRTLGRQ